MAAYGALVSLSKVIDLNLFQQTKYVLPYSREQMMSLHEEIGLLQDLLEDLSGRSHDPSIDVLESRIRDVAYQLEDIIEIILSPVAKTPSTVPIIPSPVAIKPSAFDICAGEIGILLEEAMAMKENYLQDNDTPGASHPLTTGSSSSEPPSAKVDFNQNEILDRIFGRGSNLEILPITGMGGIGKTTLARAVYEHPNTKRHFDICSWVTVSQEYNVNEILRGLLPLEQQNAPDERLIEFLHKRLIGRTFLIVLDDLWDVKAWDGVLNAFHDDNRGSRIIVTTRLLGVAEYVGSSTHVHEMQFLNDEQSWNLLREKVGENTHWSEELEDLGRTISRNCRGLPLAIVAIGGLLRFNMSEEYWKQVARDSKSEVTANYDNLFSILALSYTNLPPYLKACFLYLGSYEEDEEISTTEVVRLWTSEGFLKPRGSKEMEEVAEEYLEELVARSLVLVQKKRLDGRIKTCSLHDVLRDLSLRKAHEEKFYHHIMRSSSWVDMYSNNDLRRASIDPDCFTEELVHHRHVRSLRFNEDEEVLSVIQHFNLIKVLGTVRITMNSQLGVLYELTNLRYLHIFLDGEGLPPLLVGESISKLHNLETLIFSGNWLTEHDGYILNLPSEIWEMRHLRHLILVRNSILPCPSVTQISCTSLHALHTLSEVTDFDLTRSIAAKLSSLKKLKLFYTSNMTPIVFRLNNLVLLHQLEELNVESDGTELKVRDLSFPQNLKKLSLNGTGMPVEKMSLIGSLPNLEVLKLKEESVIGSEWEPIEGEFLQLKYLKMQSLSLEEWRAGSEHFPELETLIIKKCWQLQEVPAGIGEINTLQKLVLDDCDAAKESVEEIKAEQESLCNNLLQVTIIKATSWFLLTLNLRERLEEIKAEKEPMQ